MNPTAIVEGVLHSLQIQFKKNCLPHRVLFFCRNPEGTSFNLELGADNAVYIWRFIRTDLPDVKPGKKTVYNLRSCNLGLEITSEQDLSLFSQQQHSPETLVNGLCAQINIFLKADNTLRFVEHPEAF